MRSGAAHTGVREPREEFWGWWGGGGRAIAGWGALGWLRAGWARELRGKLVGWDLVLGGVGVGFLSARWCRGRRQTGLG